MKGLKSHIFLCFRLDCSYRFEKCSLTLLLHQSEVSCVMLMMRHEQQREEYVVLFISSSCPSCSGSRSTVPAVNGGTAGYTLDESPLHHCYPESFLFQQLLILTFCSVQFNERSHNSNNLLLEMSSMLPECLLGQRWDVCSHRRQWPTDMWTFFWWARRWSVSPLLHR